VTRENERKTTDAAKQGSEIDREVLDIIEEEKRKGRARGPKDPKTERKKKKLAEDGLRAIKAKDARVFTELLKQAGIRENSPEWKNAWKAFYEG
jgi:hypothetical protein